MITAGNDHRDLPVWKKAMEFVTDIYRETRAFPADEGTGIREQLRRAAVSLAANIAEGHGRGSTKEFRHFLCQAAGCLSEAETVLEIAARLGYLSDDAAVRLLGEAKEVGRMLNSLRHWCEAA